MNHQQLIKFGLSFKGTSMRYPFRPYLPVLFVGEKMFALLGHMQDIEYVNLKTSTEEAWIQRKSFPNNVIPGYHMNKNHWNTVLLNGTVPDQLIMQMLEDSYHHVIANMTKKARQEFI